MQNRDGWLEVVNLDKLVEFSRKLIYYNFDNPSTEVSDQDFFHQVENIKHEDAAEMEELLPFDEAKNIMKSVVFSKRHKKTKQVKYFMKESDYNEILLQLNQRMVSNIVMGLVKKGVLESAFDDEKNDFIFWVKHNQNETN